MKKHWKAFFFLLVQILIFSACSSSAAPPRQRESFAAPQPTMQPNTKSIIVAEEMNSVNEDSPASTTSSTEVLLDDRKIIYQGDMFLVVNDTEQAAKDIQTMAESMGGYVAQMSGYRQNGRMVYDLTLRIPAEKFDAFRESLRNLAVRVENERIRTDDVTDQYFDLEARIKTLKETEAELRELLRKTEERGGDVEDIMNIYDKLTDIRSQIESLQGQLNRLDKLVAFSTLDIHLEPHILTEPIEPAGGWYPGETIRESIDILVNILATLATWFIEFIIVVVPILIILSLPPIFLLWLVRHWQKRRQRH